jgi:hypothetical protein
MLREPSSCDIRAVFKRRTPLKEYCVRSVVCGKRRIIAIRFLADVQKGAIYAFTTTFHVDPRSMLAGIVKADPVILDTRAVHYVNGGGNASDLLVTSLTLHPDIVAQQIFGPNDLSGFITFDSQLIGPAGMLLHGEFFYDG